MTATPPEQVAADEHALVEKIARDVWDMGLLLDPDEAREIARFEAQVTAAKDAEIARFRSALETIANGEGIGGPNAELQCADIARSALAPQKEAP